MSNNAIITFENVTKSYDDTQVLKNINFEIEKGKFVGKGSLSDTDELPDGRRITKHSFWMPKKFIKEILAGNWD